VSRNSSGLFSSGQDDAAEKLDHSEIPFLTLDDQTTLDTARADPVGFVRGLDRAVIDEIQRAPEILVAIKRSVDTDKRPGRFLLTGSASSFVSNGPAPFSGTGPVFQAFPPLLGLLALDEGCHDPFATPP
jgi:AAA domain